MAATMWIQLVAAMLARKHAIAISRKRLER